MPGPARFPPSARLHKPAEFKLVFAEGRKLRRVPLSVSYRRNMTQDARLGLAIAKKAVAQAHDRNRIKRLIREEFRHNRARLPAVDLVFFAQPGLAAVPNPELRGLLSDLWTQVIERCARSSPAPSAPISAP
ncbi:MAG: ribonuclease P protein component [Nevskia sp.]|nr:ribonuclease P protein component [Gammaproteobacteria bacterium]MDH4458081.1 ribonuclease P protein component [Nevskia sp.]